jgi:hypothetical protein
MGTLANRIMKKRPASWAKGALPMMLVKSILQDEAVA